MVKRKLRTAVAVTGFFCFIALAGMALPQKRYTLAVAFVTLGVVVFASGYVSDSRS
jgi:hypothetical protein